jgi:hypothetical protein
MNPYLEKHFGDIAATAVALSSAKLNRILPDDLCARMDERLFLEDPRDDYTTESFMNIIEPRAVGRMFTRIEFLRPVETKGLEAYEASIGLARGNGLNIVILDLQSVFEQCLENGRYSELDYIPPDPPLEAADAQWAATLLKGTA